MNRKEHIQLEKEIGRQVEIAQLQIPYFNLLDDIEKSKKVSITIPTNYKDKVSEVKKQLKDDISGIVNSTLDFAIDSCLVKYPVKSKRSSSIIFYEKWFKIINQSFRGRYPVGLKGIAKEYFRELLAGSSNILLRTLWEKVNINGISVEVPTKMWLVDGEDILIEDKNNDSVVLGQEKYYLIKNIQKGDKIQLPALFNEKIYAQRPFESWGIYETTPFLIRRGIYKNMRFLKLIVEKSEIIIESALEYLLLFKKGTERMFLEKNKGYGLDELREIQKNFKESLKKKTVLDQIPVAFQQFDTEIEHLIPDYEKVLKPVLQQAVIQRILQGFGLVEFIQGVQAGSRRESVFNPKPFIKLVESSIDSFLLLMNDIIQDIEDRNKFAHSTLFNEKNETKIVRPILYDFLSDKILLYMRSIWDRGLMGDKSFFESTIDMNFMDQIDERKWEKEEKIDKLMYPRKTQNMEDQLKSQKSNTPDVDKNNNIIPDDKVNKSEKKNYENAKYSSIKDLPEQLNVLPSKAKQVWKDVFNDNIDKGENQARKIAWTAVKKGWKKNKDGKWINKE